MPIRLAALALLLSAPAWAQSPGADPLDVYTAIDSDGNGLISEAEARVIPGLTRTFNRLDSNRSGQLDFREFSNFELETGGRKVAGALAFGAVDTDNDGFVSQEEAASHPALVQEWLQLDRDESGTLDKAEFAAFERPDEVIAPATAAGGHTFEAFDRDGNDVIDSSEARASDFLVKRWPQFDADESGTLDRAEFASLAQAEDAPSMEPADFAELDRDGDGAISRAEAAANPYLADNWQRLDNDGDNQLDRAEFSAFERTFKDGLERLPTTSGR